MNLAGISLRCRGRGGGVAYSNPPLTEKEKMGFALVLLLVVSIKRASITLVPPRDHKVLPPSSHLPGQISSNNGLIPGLLSSSVIY